MYKTKNNTSNNTKDMTMKKILKPGTTVRLTKEYQAWSAKHSDETYLFPDYFIRKPEYAKEEINSYLMNRYSLERDLPVDGVIVGDNGYSGDDFAYLVWLVNEIGEDLSYMDPEDLETL